MTPTPPTTPPSEAISELPKLYTGGPFPCLSICVLRDAGTPSSFGEAGEPAVFDTVCVLWDDVRKEAPAELKRIQLLMVFAAESYRKHFPDPIQAAERDALGEAVRLLERINRVVSELSNHDRIKKPPRSQAEWDRTHAAIEEVRAFLATTKDPK